MPKRLPTTLGFKRYALHLDGIDDYVEVPHSDSINPTEAITISVLIFPTKLGVVNPIVEKYPASSPYPGYGFRIGSDNELMYWSSEHGSWVSLPCVISEANRWYHVAISVGADGKVHTYLNGEYKGYASSKPPGYGTSNLMVGTNGDLKRTYFNGLIALVRIYNRPLSQEEIKWNTLNYHSPVRDGLVLWLYDKIVGDTWYDESPYNNNGTIYGAVRKELAMWEIRASIL